MNKTSRANKTLSNKRVISTNYLNNINTNKVLNELLDLLSSYSIDDIMYTLCISLLKYHNILNKDNVKKYIDRFNNFNLININIENDVWNTDGDVLGFIYQSLITEGERNKTGQYYTHSNIVKNILYNDKDNNIIKDNTRTYLDPCCGSGMFLCNIQTNHPENLFGFDINNIAVLITGTNLLVKYKEHNFEPKVYCLDFLNSTLNDFSDLNIPTEFDCVFTNPPWGADKDKIYVNKFPMIKSKEKSSMFIVKSIDIVKENGELCFILPSSLLKIKTHKDIRHFIINNTKIKQINIYDNSFDGVFTDFFGIKILKEQCNIQTYIVNNKNTFNVTLQQNDIDNDNIPTKYLNETDLSIINKIENKKYTDLSSSKFALGIVTGDNKNKLITDKSKVNLNTMELIYGGKQVTPFNLTKTDTYINFNPSNLQQCAKEEYYKCNEKLIYKFISRYPVVSYDDKQCLCLNSANIIIPNIKDISMKIICALLNSSLYKYYYCIKFDDIKVLKDNLKQLPIPYINKQENILLTNVVNNILINGFNETYKQEIDNIIYNIFNINAVERNYIETYFK